MKSFAIRIVWFTTIYIFVYAGLCQTNSLLPIVLIMLFFGLLLIPFMVYMVLNDDYKTQKTFKDWYGDFPLKTLDEKEQ